MCESGRDCQDCAQISVLDFTLLVVLKSHELAFSVIIESVSRDASNDRINGLYSCRKHKKTGSVLHQDLNFALGYSRNMLFDFAD